MTTTAAPAARTRILIAADHLPTRMGLRLALEAEAACSEAKDSASAVAAAVRDRPDVCLLDFAAPELGLRAVREIVSRVPGAVVIVLTKHVQEDEFLAVLRAGARGYLPQNLDPGRLPFVVQSVLRGEAAVPRHFVTKLIDELRERGRGRRAFVLPDGRRLELTPRESDVLHLLRQGLATSEIAARLQISPVTVRRHLTASYASLGVSSRQAALALLTELSPLPG